MKKVSVNKWKKLLSKDRPTDHEAVVHFPGTDETLSIMVKSNLQMMDRMSFAKEIVESCFDEIDGSYIPYAFDVSFGIMMIQYFTNIDVGSDIGLAFKLVEESDIIQVIKGYVDENTMNCIEAEVYELLQWEKSRRSKSTKADELYDALTTLVESFSGMADSAKENLDSNNITDLTEILKRFGNQEDLAKAVISARKETK